MSSCMNTASWSSWRPACRDTPAPPASSRTGRWDSLLGSVLKDHALPISIYKGRHELHKFRGGGLTIFCINDLIFF